jgi:hypothetical protein
VQGPTAPDQELIPMKIECDYGDVCNYCDGSINPSTLICDGCVMDANAQAES